jgi:uncharacterized membrane protein
MDRFFRLTYWFNLRPQPIGLHTEVYFLIFCAVLIALYIFIKVKRKKEKKFSSRLYRSLADFSLTNAIVAFLLVFANWQMIPIVIMKLWLGVWLAEMIFWGWLMFSRLQKTKDRKEDLEQQKVIKKYIPK